MKLVQHKCSKLSKPALFLSVAFVLISAQTSRVRYQKIFVKAPFRMPAMKVPIFPERVFFITDFGARPGDKARNTEAIRTHRHFHRGAGSGVQK
jgi:hypothetical protein